jgi:hypothetical protein
MDERVPPKPSRRSRQALNRRLRAAFLAGAEERSLRVHGRGLTDAELGSILAEYPGDLPTTLVTERD